MLVIAELQCDIGVESRSSLNCYLFSDICSALLPRDRKVFGALCIVLETNFNSLRHKNIRRCFAGPHLYLE